MVGGMPGGGYGGACVAGGMHGGRRGMWGACMAGDMYGKGHVWQGGGMHGKGHVCATHAPCHTRPPAPTCGQCADGTHPYWNAFLFMLPFLQQSPE